jgi:hypothetical protein
MVYVVDALEGYYARWMQINGVMEKISYNILLVFLLTGTVLAGLWAFLYQSIHGKSAIKKTQFRVKYTS